MIPQGEIGFVLPKPRWTRAAALSVGDVGALGDVAGVGVSDERGDDFLIFLKPPRNIRAARGLPANEVATLDLDDIDWRSGEMLICAKGRQRPRMPMPPDIGAAVVAYLSNGRPTSSCRRLFLRTLGPNVGFASGCAISMIAKTALERAGIRGYSHHGAHIFRHSLATELLRSGATLSEIGQLLRHEGHDTTRIYAKVDIKALRTLSLPWPGGAR
jgi:site-specific recombinase XerD